MEVWIWKLQSFKCSESLILSQFLPRVMASITKVWVKPLDLAWANLVLLSSVKLATVSISISQFSNCVKSLPLKVGISWIKVFAKVVCFWAEHRVSVYCCNTSSRGSGGAEGWRLSDNLWNSYSKWLIASIGDLQHFQLFAINCLNFWLWPSGWHGFHVPHI